MNHRIALPVLTVIVLGCGSSPEPAEQKPAVDTGVECEKSSPKNEPRPVAHLFIDSPCKPDGKEPPKQPAREAAPPPEEEVLCETDDDCELPGYYCYDDRKDHDPSFILKGNCRLRPCRETVTYPDSNEVDRRFYHFNGGGHLICKEWWNDGKESSVWSAAYDAEGRKVAEDEWRSWKRKHKRTAFEYGTRGNVTAERKVDDHGFTDDLKTFTYDDEGNLLRSESLWHGRVPMASSERTYDTSGKLLTVKYVDLKNDGYSSVSHKYDAKGRLSEETFQTDDQQNSRRVYVYDDEDRLARMEEGWPGAKGKSIFRFEYDDEGRAVRAESDGDFFDDHPPDGKADQTTTIAYDAQGRQSRKELDFGGGSVDQRYVSHYDERGRLVRVDEYFLDVGGLKKRRVRNYSYDCWK